MTKKKWGKIKNLKGIFEKIEEERDADQAYFLASHGLVKRSGCCSKPIVHSRGGVRLPICSHCGKYEPETRYKCK